MPMASVRASLAGLYGWLYSEARQAWLERLIGDISVAGFLAHPALVFGNAAFVISTILIRFSLPVARPFAAGLALSGMVFGI